MKKILSLIILTISINIVSAQQDFALEQFFLTDTLPVDNDYFGNDFKVLGNYLFIGSKFDDTQATNNGAVSIFKRTDTNSPWILFKKLYPSDLNSNTYFGEGIDAEGDLLVVGGAGWGSSTSNNHGVVYIFRKDEGGTDNWGQIKRIVPSITGDNSDFGEDLDLDGDKLLVGANGQKRAYLYQQDSGGTDNWGQIKTFADDAVRRMGQDVALKDGIAIVGGGWYNSGYTSNAGRAYIYGIDEGGTDNWGLIKFVSEFVNTFGANLDYDGTTLAVNSVRYNGTGASSYPGRCWIFSRDEGGTNNFGLIGFAEAEDQSLVDWYGYGVSIDGDNLVVGARLSSDYQSYYYTRNKGGSNNWGEVGVLTHPDQVNSDLYGYHIDIQNQEIFIGAAAARIGSDDVGKVYGFSLDSCFTTHTFLYDTITYENTFFFAGEYVDQDGLYYDTIVTSQGCDSVVILELYIDSKISFADKYDFASGNGTYDIAIGDLTGDGKNDMVSANYLGSSISLFWNVGTPGVIDPSTFFPSSEVFVGDNITAVEIADISGDGINDIIVASYNNDSIYVFKNIYTSGLLNASSFDPPVAYAAGNGPWEMETEDLDGDGQIDVIVTNRFDESVSVFGNFSFSNTVFLAPKLDYSLGFEQGSALAFGDLNNDSKKDILITSSGGEVLLALENNGVPNGISFLPVTYVEYAGGNGGSAQIEDFNGDGCDDIYQTFYQSGYTNEVYKNGCATGNIDYNNFTDEEIFSWNAPTNYLYGMVSRKADLDKNGKMDFVFTSSRSSSSFNSIFFAIANISNTDTIIDASDFNTKYDKIYSSNFNGIVTPISFERAINIRLGDLDGDGLEDLAVINYGDDKIMVFKNTSIVSTILTDTLATSIVGGATYCSNGSIEIAIESNATFIPGNQFVVEMSDSTGDFTNANTIAVVEDILANNISATIPLNTSSASGYLFRVISTQPYIIGEPNDNPINISESFTLNISDSICLGDSILFGGDYYSTAGMYTDSFQNASGCDSLVVLNLTYTNIVTQNVMDTICAGDDYLFGSQMLTISGTYQDTIANSMGCNTVVNLTLTVIPTTGSTIDTAICQGDMLAFGGLMLNSTGQYFDTLLNDGMCDSILTLNLTVNPASGSTIDTAICQGDMLTFGGLMLNATGQYFDTVMNGGMCDSIITLNLTVNPVTGSTMDTAICQGDMLTFGGLMLNATGQYFDTAMTGAMCDSIVTLNLTVNPVTGSTLDTAICQGASYAFGGLMLNTTGQYFDTVMNSTMCDSIVTLNLTVNPVTGSTVDTAICQGDSYAFGGMMRNSAGQYFDTLMNSTMCDSIVTLNLTVNPSTGSTIDTAICQGDMYAFGGTMLNTAGLYFDTVMTGAMCDSIVTLNLTVNPVTGSTIDTAICQGEMYDFGGLMLNTAGQYLDTLMNGAMCDSILTLNLTVNPATGSIIDTAICQGEMYDFGGLMLNATGQYLDTLMNGAMCDSILTLNLTVNPATGSTIDTAICQGEIYAFGGLMLNATGQYFDTAMNVVMCDSIITLNLTVNPVTGSTIDTAICQGDIYVFGGLMLNATGQYFDTVTNGAMCDSILTLNLMVNPVTGSTIDIAICQGEMYDFGGLMLNATGQYFDTLMNGAMCDSIITLNLTVNPATGSTIDTAICQGDMYSFGGAMLNATGQYFDTVMNSAMCDSIVTLNLTVDPAIGSTIDSAICQGAAYAFGGAMLSSTGQYFDTVMNVLMCDSIITLNLTVNPATGSTMDTAICQGEIYAFGGLMLNATGQYFDTVTNGALCDSIVTLNLTVNPTSSSTIDTSICVGESYLFAGNSYNTSGQYTATLMAANGCDSTVVLNLTVKAVSNTTITDTICFGDTYPFGGNMLTSTGLYFNTLTNANGCDSTVSLILLVYPTTNASPIYSTLCDGDSIAFGTQTISAGGMYYDTLLNAYGCDSLVTLNVTLSTTGSSTINETICQGDVYDFGGVMLNTAGQFFDTLMNGGLCNTIVTLNLTVNAPSASAVDTTICQGATYAFGGLMLNTTGQYFDTVMNIAMCDSVITLNLTVNPSTGSTIDTSICQGDSYAFGGNMLNSTGQYFETLMNSNMCDSVVILNLTVNPATGSTIDTSICQGDSYAFGGTMLNSTGQYFETLMNSNMCDSVVTLNLTVNPTSDSSVNASICEGEDYAFGGVTYNISGQYFDTLMNSNMCDSIITLNLTVNPTNGATITAAICQGANYDFGGSMLNTTGQYFDTLMSSAMCDSIVTLNLTVNPNSASNTTDTICAGSFYIFGAAVYSNTGVYSDTLMSANDCDSIAVLDLTVNAVSNTSLSDTICTGDAYNFGGIMLSTTGIYFDTLSNEAGCDSIVSLDLMVNPTSASNLFLTLCEGDTIVFGSQTVDSSGMYNDTLQNANGCDSIVTLSVSILTNSDTLLNDTICAGDLYDFGGLMLDTSGTYTSNLQNSNGCDSIITLELVVNAASGSAIADTICFGEQYMFAGATLTEAGMYFDTVSNATTCDSIVTLSLMVELFTDTTSITICPGDTIGFAGQNLTDAGLYYDTISNGILCDSIVVLDLSISAPPLVLVSVSAINIGESIDFYVANASNASSYLWDFGNGTTSMNSEETVTFDSAGIYVVVLTGTNDLGCVASDTVTIEVGGNVAISDYDLFNAISLYPNPTSNAFNLSFDLSKEEAIEINLISMEGKIVHTQRAEVHNDVVNIQTTSLAAGVYFVRISSGQKQRAFKLELIK